MVKLLANIFPCIQLSSLCTALPSPGISYDEFGGGAWRHTPLSFILITICGSWRSETRTCLSCRVGRSLSSDTAAHSPDILSGAEDKVWDLLFSFALQSLFSSISSCFTMQLIQAFLLLSTIFAQVSAAKYTFWVDKSCDDHTHFKGSLQDAFDMAKRSAERLESSTDKDYANVFSLVFGTDKSDQTQYKPPYGISIQLEHTNPDKPAKTTAYKIVHGKSTP